MADYTHTGLKVVGLHEPDYSTEKDGNGVPHQVELPGFYTVGVEIDGVFVPILRRKAAGLFADIERAKNSQSDTASSS
jgi:hypothetical protein